ncbi:transglycosylase SLT domain-containing protein [Motiliproteus sediminis]|uniref:transglycosylase SLT domain-containing protein n=1 Tax=Motiliproteus sediminis TaxID=1468178 RepID=UPI001AEF6E21|nr:transglycosylase SLT domain-containing protein [Motiliproteus sediminis]
MRLPPALFAALIAVTLLLSGCATAPPSNISNSCEIFYDKDDWYEATKDSFEKWGVPIHVQLAIVHQESKFQYDARPPKDYLLGFIPWGRKSSAYGYAQVKDETWDWYRQKTGNWGADRDDFADAVDFIGWYGSMSYQMLGISKWDARNQYLAYHEGHGGFKRKTYNQKAWLVQVAKKVDNNAARYRAQLGKCRERLESGWSLWPF